MLPVHLLEVEGQQFVPNGPHYWGCSLGMKSTPLWCVWLGQAVARGTHKIPPVLPQQLMSLRDKCT